MIIGFLIIGGVMASGVALYKVDQAKKEKKLELDRIKRDNARKEMLKASTAYSSPSSENTSAPFVPLKSVHVPDDDGEMFNCGEHGKSGKSYTSDKPKKVYRSKHNSDTVHETHTTTVVNNYHDDDDGGAGAFTGAMLGSMVGNAMTQPVVPVVPVTPFYEPAPVYVEPSSPEVIETPPDNDGGSDVRYDGNDSTSDDNSDNNYSNDDGGSDVKYDGNDSSSDWSDSSSDTSSNSSDDSWGSSDSGSSDSWGSDSGSSDSGDSGW